jgi:hypothetical protein
MKLLHPDRHVSTGLSRFGVALLVALPLGVGAFAASAQQEPPKAEADERTITNVVPLDDPKSLAIETKRTLVAALRTLIAAQNDDGSWSANADGRDPHADFGGAGELDDIGVTGVALLALIDGPGDVDIPGRREAIARALAFLAFMQDPESGAFPTVRGNIYVLPSHALATRAFVRASVRIDPSPGAAWRSAAQRAIDFISRNRNPYMGWRYSVPPDGDNDSVVTSWMLLALAEARDAGLEVATEDAIGGLTFLAEMTDDTNGRIGYQTRGVGTSRLAAKAATHPGEHVELETATALCAQQAWPGVEPRRAPAARPADSLAGSALVAVRPPSWDIEAGSIDSYYWAFGARAVRQVGGPLVERWNARLGEALVTNAVRDADGNVSWPAVDAWHVAGQEVAQTAWFALALEALP